MLDALEDDVIHILSKRISLSEWDFLDKFYLSALNFIPINNELFLRSLYNHDIHSGTRSLNIFQIIPTICGEVNAILRYVAFLSIVWRFRLHIL